MAIVVCSRCDRWVDLDWCVESMVVLQNGRDWCCRDCLEDDEVCEECGEPMWDCRCVAEIKETK
jgi:hypothetical protein